MEQTPLRHVSRGIITDSDGRILLVQNGSREKPYTLPGGHVEADETFQDALLREIQEELGIVVELVGNTTRYREPNVQSLPAPVRVKKIEFTNMRGPQNNYEEYFLAHYVSWTMTVQVSEIASFGWFTLDQIKNMWPGEIYMSIQDIILSAVH